MLSSVQLGFCEGRLERLSLFSLWGSGHIFTSSIENLINAMVSL
jgi:hypothetical protein